MIYTWRTKMVDSLYTKVPAQQVGDRLEAIRRRHTGRLSPALVVADARSRRSVLHPLFEWDDAVAAEKQRMWQARTIIGAIITTVEREDDSGRTEAIPIRAFVHVRQTAREQPSYISVSAALSDPILREQIIVRALKELDAWRHRYEALAEFADIFRTIDAMIAEQQAMVP